MERQEIRHRAIWYQQLNLCVDVPDNSIFCTKPAALVAAHTELTMMEYCEVGSIKDQMTWMILGLRPANERRRYFVTTSLIGWAQT